MYPCYLNQFKVIVSIPSTVIFDHKHLKHSTSSSSSLFHVTFIFLPSTHPCTFHYFTFIPIHSQIHSPLHLSKLFHHLKQFLLIYYHQRCIIHKQYHSQLSLSIISIYQNETCTKYSRINSLTKSSL